MQRKVFLMKRIKLQDRILPCYTHGEEIMNMVTHITGGGLAVVALVLCLLRAIRTGSTIGVVCSLVYGLSMIGVYSISSVYHGLRPGMGKKVMQVIDHCAIYFLIAGTYTPIVLCAIAPVYPAIGCGLFLWQWMLVCAATVLTAIDLKKYRVFSMICYVGMGWSIIFFLLQAMACVSPAGFWFLLAGGIAYTVGAVLFGLGKRLRWMHSVFHIFVVLGSVLQLITILCYVL